MMNEESKVSTLYMHLDMNAMTHDIPDGLLLCRSRLFHCIIKDEIKENIEPTESTADFAAALNVYEQFLVHELSGHCDQLGKGIQDHRRKIVYLLEFWLRCFRHDCE